MDVVDLIILKNIKDGLGIANDVHNTYYKKK